MEYISEEWLGGVELVEKLGVAFLECCLCNVNRKGRRPKMRT